jgi:ubiquinone/menaquinone biosynthesis C-methylase UbiE
LRYPKRFLAIDLGTLRSYGILPTYKLKVVERSFPVQKQISGPDQSFYAEDTSYFEPEYKLWLANHLRVLDLYIKPVLPALEKLQSQKSGGVRFVELGAGTCLTSLILKKHFPNAHFTCVDISLKRMEALIEKGAKETRVDPAGINLVECDFSGDLPFEDQVFDIVVFDASLHHSRNIWSTLQECARILIPCGAVVALREQYLAPLTAKYAMTRLLNTPEVRSGVSENAYLKEQYEYYFKTAHFDTKFFRVAPRNWRWLSLLNGYAFSKWSILATKKS